MIRGVEGREIRGRVSLRYKKKHEVMCDDPVTWITYSIARE